MATDFSDRSPHFHATIAAVKKQLCAAGYQPLQNLFRDFRVHDKYNSGNIAVAPFEQALQKAQVKHEDARALVGHFETNGSVHWHGFCAAIAPLDGRVRALGKELWDRVVPSERIIVSELVPHIKPIKPVDESLEQDLQIYAEHDSPSSHIDLTGFERFVSVVSVYVPSTEVEKMFK